jgi:hypothetical protein
MSTDKFSDLAEREYFKQTTKQKKITFGERPMTILNEATKHRLAKFAIE